MKILSFYLVFITIFIYSFSFAQITITSNDISNTFALGNNVTINEDTLVNTADIGAAGGGNNWDFTGLASNLTINMTSIDPASGFMSNEFPGADFTTHSVSTIGGDSTEIWSYTVLGGGTFDNMGNVATLSSFPGFSTIIKNDPPRRMSVVPYTYLMFWNQIYTQTILVNGTPISTSNVQLDAEVDAYGTLTLPGGASFNALRVRETMIITTLGISDTSTNFNFITQNGAQVNITPTDPIPPLSGTISIEDASWNLPIATSVEQISGLPEDYSIKQNYPNPFNPSTNIEYSIPSESFVELKVYDILGNEITTLVNEQQQAGVYRTNFIADNLPSGMYFARISANNFTKVVKMTLLK
ncbi:MAG: hypothetical protein BMS9Abin39_0099 [Ignavibacteria bacterium]|nr:MAG: hypothetical protein BMS9Abin39_0099 [Ignavibacteria bacterium]